METLKISKYIGAYKLSFTYFLADFLLKGDHYPLYCRVNFLRKTTKFRSIVMPDLYDSFKTATSNKILLEKECESIAAIVMQSPKQEDHIKQAVSQYLDIRSPYRLRIPGLKLAYDSLRADIFNGIQPTIALQRFEILALDILSKNP